MKRQPSYNHTVNLVSPTDLSWTVTEDLEAQDARFILVWSSS